MFIIKTETKSGNNSTLTTNDLFGDLKYLVEKYGIENIVKCYDMETNKVFISNGELSETIKEMYDKITN